MGESVLIWQLKWRWKSRSVRMSMQVKASQFKGLAGCQGSAERQVELKHMSRGRLIKDLDVAATINMID